MGVTPKVSIIMPAYNSAGFIEESIRSVLSQTYTDWELFVIDDASTDNTAAIVKDLFLKDRRIKFLQLNENQGTGAARNKGTEAATGTFIAFLDADDLWIPEKLEIQVKFMLEKDLEMTFSSYFLMDEKGNRLNKFVEALPILSYKKLLKSNYVGNLTGIYNAKKTGKIYAPLLRKRQDWALWLILLKKTGTVLSIQEPLAIYRIRKNSLSGNKVALVSFNYAIYRKFLRFDALTSSKYLATFLWEHFFVKKSQVKSIADLN